MTSLLRFIAADPIGKATVISRLVAEYGEPYHPARDYWKQLRDGLRALHEAGLPADVLRGLVPAHNARKAQNYELMIQGYEKWRARIDFSEPAFPERREWIFGDIAFLLNPEVAATIDGVPHVIKLHFRSEGKLRKRLADPMIAVMDHYYREVGVASILDVRRARLFTARDVQGLPKLRTAMHGQASAFGAMWRDAQREVA